MYLSVDIGGTKTLIAVFNGDGELVVKHKSPTDHDFDTFMVNLKNEIKKVWTKEIKAITVAAPGRINRKTNVVVSFGNLPWENVDIAGELADTFSTPVFIDNDANLAGLAEAHTPSAEKYRKVLYVTVSTGIGTGFVVDGELSPLLADSEGGHIIFEHEGEQMDWEDFASGSAIKKTYGKFAYEIENEETWESIAHGLSVGFQHLIAILQPDLIVVGGSIGTHFDKFSKYLNDDLKKMASEFSDNLFEFPDVAKAKHPQQSVVYGGYLLSKSRLGK